MYDVVSWHVIFGSDHRKYMVYVNASVEARSALIPPIMGFEVVRSIELPKYYLFSSSLALNHLFLIFVILWKGRVR